MKKCSSCKKQLNLCDFYKHSGMADGHLNKCKECVKRDVKKNRIKNLVYYVEYEKNRASLPKRRLARENYRKTENGKKAFLKANRIWRLKNKEKYKAHADVAYALKNKKIKKKPCQICGKTNSHAHHNDYKKPLDVIWVCNYHHKKIYHSKE